MTYKCEVCGYETDAQPEGGMHCGQQIKEVASEVPAEEEKEEGSAE